MPQEKTPTSPIIEKNTFHLSCLLSRRDKYKCNDSSRQQPKSFSHFHYRVAFFGVQYLFFVLPYVFRITRSFFFLCTTRAGTAKPRLLSCVYRTNIRKKFISFLLLIAAWLPQVWQSEHGTASRKRNSVPFCGRIRSMQDLRRVLRRYPS